MDLNCLCFLSEGYKVSLWSTSVKICWTIDNSSTLLPDNWNGPKVKRRALNRQLWCILNILLLRDIAVPSFSISIQNQPHLFTMMTEKRLQNGTNLCRNVEDALGTSWINSQWTIKMCGLYPFDSGYNEVNPHSCTLIQLDCTIFKKQFEGKGGGWLLFWFLSTSFTVLTLPPLLALTNIWLVNV